MQLEQVIEEIIKPENLISDTEGLKLFNDVGMIYELQLAKLELIAFENRLDEFHKRTAYFEEVKGKKSYHYYISEVKGKGQIGRTNQYLTHWFYPYKGKFHGQMIKAILNFIAPAENLKILDPYNGSGTTLVEASTINLNGYGVEINPALCIIAQIKCDLLNFKDVREFKQFWKKEDLSRILDFFQNKRKRKWRFSLKNINKPAKEIIEEMWDTEFPKEYINELPYEWKNTLFMVFIHSLSDFTYLRGTSKEKPLHIFFKENLEAYTKTLEDAEKVFNELRINPKPQNVIFGDAKNLPFEDEFFDGIVTSPPYSIALDYVKNDEHLLNYLGINTIDLRNLMVGLRGEKKSKIELYSMDIRKSLIEMNRVVKKGGWVVLVLGDVVVNSKRTDFCKKILEWYKDLGFSYGFSIKRPILGGFARLRYEYIIFLQK